MVLISTNMIILKETGSEDAWIEILLTCLDRPRSNDGRCRFLIADNSNPTPFDYVYRRVFGQASLASYWSWDHVASANEKTPRGSDSQ